MQKMEKLKEDVTKNTYQTILLIVFVFVCVCVCVCVWLYLSVRVELALMLPGEAMQPQHVVQLLPWQTEVGVVRVCVRVCGVVTQQDTLQETERERGRKEWKRNHEGVRDRVMYQSVKRLNL